MWTRHNAFQQFLADQGACDEATDFCASQEFDLERCVTACPDLNWFGWLLRRCIDACDMYREGLLVEGWDPDTLSRRLSELRGAYEVAALLGGDTVTPLPLNRTTWVAVIVEPWFGDDTQSETLHQFVNWLEPRVLAFVRVAHGQTVTLSDEVDA